MYTVQDAPKDTFEITLYLRDLQMQHSNSKHGKSKGQLVSVPHQNTDMPEVQAQKRRGTAEFTNVCGVTSWENTAFLQTMYALLLSLSESV